MRLQQLRADFISDFGDVGIRPELGNFKNQFAGKRIAVGVQASGRQRNQSVARLDALAGQKFLAFDCADDEAGEIILTGRIKAGHPRGLTADEGAAGLAARAAHAYDKLLDDVGIEFPHREVVEEKQRLRALDENVVDAVIDKVAADGGMDFHGHGDFELGADAICAGDEDGLFPFFAVEREERAETADTAENTRSESAAGMVADALLGVIRDSDIHSGIGIFHEKPDRSRFWAFLIGAHPAAHRSLTGNHWSAAKGCGSYFQKRLFRSIKTSGKSGSSARFWDATRLSRKQETARESSPAPKPLAKRSTTCK